MKLRSFVCVGLCVFPFTSNISAVNAMNFISDGSLKSQYSSRRSSVAENPQYSNKADNIAKNPQYLNEINDAAANYQYPSENNNAASNYQYSSETNNAASNYQYPSENNNAASNYQYSRETNNAASNYQYPSGTDNATYAQYSNMKSDAVTDYQYPSGADNTIADYLYSDKKNDVASDRRYSDRKNGTTTSYQYPNPRNSTAADCRYSNKKSNLPKNYPYPNGAMPQYKLILNVYQLQKDMNSKMIKFHRIIQTFESDIYTQTFALRNHLWLLEMLVEDQVKKQISDISNVGKNSEEQLAGLQRITGLSWPQLPIKSQREEPLFDLCWNVHQFQKLFHSHMDQLIRNVQHLQQKNTNHKNKIFNRRKFKLNQDIEQFNAVADEHLLGLRNDIKRLESIVKELVFELDQDIGFLKLKIDVSWAELERLISKLNMSWSDLQQFTESDVYTSWQMMRHYIRRLEKISTGNIREMRREVSSLGAFVYDDMSYLNLCARALQASVCGEFSYKYNRLLIHR